MNTKTCKSGHTMTGIGFDECCPECEEPWIATQQTVEAWENEFESNVSSGHFWGSIDSFKKFVEAEKQKSYEEGKKDIIKEMCEKLLENIEPYKTWVVDHKKTVEEATHSETERIKNLVERQLEKIDETAFEIETEYENKVAIYWDLKEMKKGFDDLINKIEK